MVMRLSSLLRLSEQLIIYRHVKLHISLASGAKQPCS